MEMPFSTSPNYKFLDMTKLKAFADDRLNISEMTISRCDRVENTVVKEENAGYEHFLLFPTVFSKAFFYRVIKSLDCYHTMPLFHALTL